MDLMTILTITFGVIAAMTFLYPTIRLNKKSLKLLVLIPYTIFLIALNLFVRYLGVNGQFGLWYFLTIFVPQFIIMFYYKVRDFKTFTSAFVSTLNAFLCFYIMFSIKEAFLPFIDHKLLLTFGAYSVLTPLLFLYMLFIYTKLHQIVERYMPEKLWLLLLYTVSIISEIILYARLLNLTANKVLRFNIFSVAILSVYFISIFGFYIFLKAYRDKNLQLISNTATKKQIKMILDQVDISRQNQEKMRILKHDMKHVLNNVNTLIIEEKYDEAQKLISSYNETIDSTSSTIYCENPIINALLCYFEEKCRINNIPFNVSINNFESALNIPFEDLSLIISNILDNAYNASIICEKPFINFKFVNNQGRLILQVSNRFLGLIDTDSNGTPTTTTKNHGTGSKSIAYYAKKNNLMIDYSFKNNIFKITILFNETD